MSAPPVAPAISKRFPDALREVAAILGRWYPGYKLVLVGEHPTGDERLQLRIPCPEPDGESAEVPEEWDPDGLVGAIRRVVSRRFPDADHAALMIERPGLPATTLPIRMGG
jgi:hypothetical protein